LYLLLCFRTCAIVFVFIIVLSYLCYRIRIYNCAPVFVFIIGFLYLFRFCIFIILYFYLYFYNFVFLYVKYWKRQNNFSDLLIFRKDFGACLKYITCFEEDEKIRRRTWRRIGVASPRLVIGTKCVRT